jgi:hypothetical protein
MHQTWFSLFPPSNCSLAEQKSFSSLERVTHFEASFTWFRQIAITGEAVPPAAPPCFIDHLQINGSDIRLAGCLEHRGNQTEVTPMVDGFTPESSFIGCDLHCLLVESRKFSIQA